MLGKALRIAGIIICSALIASCNIVSRWQKQEITITAIDDKLPGKTRYVSFRNVLQYLVLVCTFCHRINER